MPRHSLALLVVVALCGGGCASRDLGPVPTEQPSPVGPLQASAFTTGIAHVDIEAPSAGSFEFELKPSTIYASPPARLLLAWGDPASGLGLDLQLPPEVGTVPTSGDAVLSLTVRVDGEVVTATSMHGECSITLARATRKRAAGLFACHNLHPEIGDGPHLRASGDFTASA